MWYHKCTNPKKGGPDYGIQGVFCRPAGGLSREFAAEAEEEETEEDVDVSEYETIDYEKLAQRAKKNE